jgi:cobalt-zinc-cadmium efflux system membrane fusion protein
MVNADQEQKLLQPPGDGHVGLTAQSPGQSQRAGTGRPRMGFGQRIVVMMILVVVLVPPLAGFYSYFSGVPLHLLAATNKEEQSEPLGFSALTHTALVPGQAHSLDVPPEVAAALGIHTGERDSVAVARPPGTMRSLELPGSLDFNPSRLARIRARFAPAQVVQVTQVQDHSPRSGFTEYRELREGDQVSKGDVLAVMYSVDVASKKNDLLNALVQLELDQKLLDRFEENRYAVSDVTYLQEARAVQGDRNEITRALTILKLWEIPQAEIDALHAEARKLSADKDAWKKTPEGHWVNRDQSTPLRKDDPRIERENPWGRVTLRAPFDGVIVEQNVHVGETVVDNTVNLFQVADVSQLLVKVHCQEDLLPTLESLHGKERQWTVKTVGAGSSAGLPGFIDRIGYIIDPNQHTAIIKGYVDNPGHRFRAGQFVSAAVNIPPPGDVVEIPSDALVDDGLQAVVFVQPDPGARRFTMRRVQVTQRFDRTVFVRATPIPSGERLTDRDAEEGLLPTEPLRQGERVLVSGVVELKAALTELESRPRDERADRVARAKTGPGADLEPRRAPNPKDNKG